MQNFYYRCHKYLETYCIMILNAHTCSQSHVQSKCGILFDETKLNVTFMFSSNRPSASNVLIPWLPILHVVHSNLINMYFSLAARCPAEVYLQPESCVCGHTSVAAALASSEVLLYDIAGSYKTRC